MTEPDYFTEQLAAVRRDIANLRRDKVTYRSATVTAVDTASSTFTADVDGAGEISGIPTDSTSLPAMGEIVSLSLAGPKPVYQPPARSTVDPTSGQQSSNVTKTGVASFQRVESVEDPVFQGVPLSESIAAVRGRMVGFGLVSLPSYGGIGLGELEIMEIVFTAESGRSYGISFEGLNVGGIAGDDVVLRVRNGGSSMPTVYSPLLAGPYYDQIISGTTGSARYKTYGFDGFLVGVPDTVASSTYRLLVTLSRGAGGSGSLEVISTAAGGTAAICRVFDTGPNVLNTGVLRVATTGSSTPVQNYDITWDSSWSATYDGAGNYDSSLGSEALQGYTSYYPARGNARSIIGFPDLTGTLAGATVQSIEISFYANHWNDYDGGTAIIGHHGNASQPSTFNGTPNQLSISGWGRNQRRTVDVTAWAAQLQAGTIRGFVLGPAPTTAGEYYGRFNGAGMAEPPRIHVRYTK